MKNNIPGLLKVGTVSTSKKDPGYVGLLLSEFKVEFERIQICHTNLFMLDLSLATAASTSVLMLPGPTAFTRMLCGASARDSHLRIKGLFSF